MSMLDHVAPDLSARLRSLSLEARRRIITDVCLFMSHRTEDIEPVLQSLIGAAANHNGLSSEEVAAVRSCAETADDRYLELLANDATKAESLRWFVNARLGTALAAAFGSSDHEAAADAAYELSVLDDDATALGFIEAAIDRLGVQNSGGSPSFSVDIRRSGRDAMLTYPVTRSRLIWKDRVCESTTTSASIQHSPCGRSRLGRQSPTTSAQSFGNASTDGPRPRSSAWVSARP